MSTLMASGLQLMLVGMGTVFVFLTLLVFATSGMSWLVQRFFPSPASSQTTASLPASQTAQHEEEVAAIAVALAHHRNRGA